jgi:hypothetical protein
MAAEFMAVGGGKDDRQGLGSGLRHVLVRVRAPVSRRERRTGC